MALIKCPECGKEISEFATFCIGCGCPMTTIKQILKTKAAPNIDSDEGPSFEDKLSPNEKRFLEKFKEKTKEIFDKNVKLKDYKYYFSIQHYDLPECRFLFKKPGNILIFKYPISNGDFKEMEVSILDEITALQLINIIKSKIPSSGGKIKSDLKDVRSHQKDEYNYKANSFLDKIGQINRNIIEEFDSVLKKKMPVFEVKERKSTRPYFRKINGHRVKIGWFTFKKQKLIFKYYSQPGQSRSYISTQATSLKIDSLTDSIANNYSIKIGSVDPSVKLSALKSEGSTKTVEPKAKELERLFTTKINDSQKKYIDSFTKALFGSYRNFVEYETGSSFSYVYLPKNSRYFWFTIISDRLIFKYKNYITSKDGDIVSVDTFDKNIDVLLSIVDDINKNYLSQIKSQKRLLPIYEYIVKAIKKGHIYSSKPEVAIAEDIAKYTTDYIYEKYRLIKGFKTREDFDKYKNKYSDYTYHGRRFNFKFFSEEDAVFCFEYYIASRLLSVVQKYEKIYGQIIVDSGILLDSFYELVKNKDSLFTSVKGVNSNISLIPDEVFFEETNKYYIK